MISHIYFKARQGAWGQLLENLVVVIPVKIFGNFSQT